MIVVGWDRQEYCFLSAADTFYLCFKLYTWNMQTDCCEGHICLKCCLPLLSIHSIYIYIYSIIHLFMDYQYEINDTPIEQSLHDFTFIPYVLNTAFVYCFGAPNTLVGTSEFLLVLMFLIFCNGSTSGNWWNLILSPAHLSRKIIYQSIKSVLYQIHYWSIKNVLNNL